MKTEILKKLKMNKVTIKSKFFLMLLFVSVWSYGQGEDVTVRDLETWTSINLKYKINKKWAMAFQEQLRLDDDSSVVNQYFSQLDVTYSPFKHFDFSGGLRYSRKNDNTGDVQGYENYFRYHLDGVFKHELNNFSFKYRVRYQNKNEIGVDGEAKKYVRFKAGVGYNIRKWKLDPVLSGELYNPLDSDDENQLDKYRLTLGTSYNVHKSGKIGVFYRYEKELNTTYPKSSNIIGLKYTYTIK